MLCSIHADQEIEELALHTSFWTVHTITCQNRTPLTASSTFLHPYKYPPNTCPNQLRFLLPSPLQLTSFPTILSLSPLLLVLPTPSIRFKKERLSTTTTTTATAMSAGLDRDYNIGVEIGRGKFGTVRHCSSATTARPFAVKSVDKSSISDPLDLHCALREPKLTRLVAGHPNVISLHSVYEDSNSLHLVLDLCSGSDLYTRIITAAAPIPEHEAAALIMCPLMEAIAHCHKLGVAHRDVKPDNVLFDSTGRLVLADFGSAAWFGDGGTLMEGLFGTPYYVAPEVVDGRPYNEKIDVWSAGVILYIMLAGVPPFYGETATEIFQAVQRSNLRFPTRIFKGVSLEAKDMLRKMICKDVTKRLTAEQVLGHPWMRTCGG